MQHHPSGDPSSDGPLRTAVDLSGDLPLDRLRPQYEVERELPPGGMSRVFLARDVALDRRVVIKVLPAHLATPGALDRFRREILLVAGLHHPNIVGVISAGDVNGVPYYVMPFIEGASLAERLAASPRMPVGEATGILRDIARALAYAHARGIVHRDVKPRNVLLVGGAAVVTDFGVAKALRDAVHGGSGEHVSSARARDSLTGTGLSVGTPLYMAPEQAAGDPTIDSRADVYALGATAYEMLTGAAPFAELPPHALLRAKLTTPPPPLAVTRPDVPSSLAALVEECLATNPDDRPASADAIVERLGVAVSDTGRARAARPTSRRPRPGRALVAGGVLVAAIAAAAIGYAARAPRGAAAVPNTTDSARVAAPAGMSLVVIPVVPLSEDSSDAHLAEGLTAHLAAMLSRMPGVRVISPSRIQQLMRAGEAPDEAARRLGAAFVVEGTLERVDRQLRTTARLVDAKTGAMQWAGAFDRPTTQVFALQDDVVAGVANGIRPGAVLPSAGAAAPPQEAYELVLKGTHLVRTRRGPALREAIAAFERATKVAPGYAPAYSGLAGAYTLLPLYGTASSADALARAAVAADRAVALDSASAEAQAALAHVDDARWAWDDAQRAYKRALALAPADAATWQAYGEHLLVRGRTTEAIAALEQAVRLDSTVAVAHASLAVALAVARRTPQAIAQASLAVQGDATFPTGWMLLGAVHLFANRLPDATAALSAGLALEPRSALGLGLAANAAARSGDAEEVARLGARIDALGRAPGQALALVHLRLGTRDTTHALDALERAVAQHDPFLASEPLWSPLFDEVRGSARFTALLQRMGLDAAAR